MDAGFFKGTSADQDNRFVDKNKKLMKTMKFGEGLEKKVDMSRVDMEIIRPWINKTLSDYLGDEDDVLFEFICNQLDDPLPDGRQMQLNVTGFLGTKNAREFMQKLWQLLASAMDDICGIPEELKEQKKEQIRIKQEEQGRITETIKSHQIMIQEAIAKIKVNAAAAAINNRNRDDHHPVRPALRGRLTMGFSRSRSPRDAKNTKDAEAGNAQPKAGDHADQTTEAPPGGGPRKPRIEDDRRRKQGTYGRNRMRSPSPRRDRRRSREQSPYRKSSPRRRSRSRDSPRRDASHRRSPSPRRSKTSPTRRRSRQRRSSTPGRPVTRPSRRRPSHDDGQRHVPSDVRADTPGKRSQGGSESSGSQRIRRDRSRSGSSTAEKTTRDGKASEKQPSVFHHRNYRSHEPARRSSPEDATGPSPKPTNATRGSRNGHKKSFSPALVARNDFSPQRKRSPRYSSSVAHRHYAPSPRQNRPPEADSYAKLEPAYPSRALSPRLNQSRSQRRSLSLSPGRRAKDEPWANERRRGSPRPMRYGFIEMPRPDDGPLESSIRRRQNVSPGYRGDNWGLTSKWEGVGSRQRSPVALPEFERHARSPPIERRRISPFPDRYAGPLEHSWSPPRRNLPGPRGEYRAHVGVPRYEPPLDDFSRDGVNAFSRGISHHRQRRGDSPFRGTIHPYGSDFPEFPSARRPSPGLGPLSPPMDRHSLAYARTFSPQRRDSRGPRGGHRPGDKYPLDGLERAEDSYNAPGDKLNPRFERRGSSYDRAGHGYGPRSDQLDPRGDGGGHVNDVLRMRERARDKGDRGDLLRTDRNAGSRSDRAVSPRRYPDHRSRSPHRLPSCPGSPISPRSPRWTDHKTWKGDGVEEMERDRLGGVASRSGFSGNKSRTELENFDSKYHRAGRREGSRSLKRGRSAASSSSPGGVSRSSNRARSPSGGVDRQESGLGPYSNRGREKEDFGNKRNEGRLNRLGSPSSPPLPPTKRMKVEEVEEAISPAEGSEVEMSTKKKKKKKKEKKEKKKRKKHKKHKKHKHKREQEDEENDEDDDSNTDHETQDDELTSRTPESRSNAPDDEREFELREKAILSLRTSK